MAKYGVWMLERLVLRFSEKGGSSHGIREFVRGSLPELQRHNPQLAIELQQQPSTTRHPRLVGFYRNGRQRSVDVRNKSAEAVAEEVYWLRNSHGRGEEERVIASRHLSRHPSLQGIWNVNTFANIAPRLKPSTPAAQPSNT